jgi:hypothetical protein
VSNITLDDDEPDETTVDQNTIDLLMAMYERDGKLIPDQVVSEAADPSSPLHDRFEWDDAIAGHQHRKEQARALIRKVRLVVNQNPPVRAFVHVRSTGSYLPIREAMTVVDYREQVLEQFQRDADRFAQRWANIQIVAAEYANWLATQQAKAKPKRKRS